MEFDEYTEEEEMWEGADAKCDERRGT